MARQTRRTRVLSIRSRCRRSPSRRDRARSPKSYLSAKRRHRQHRCAPSDSIPRAATAENQSLEIKPDRGPGGAPLQPVPGVRSARAGCRAVRTARSWRGILPFTHLAREGRMTVTIGRRELLVALGGTAAAWPIAARAQQPEQMRRVVVLMSTGEDDPQDATRLAAFERGLQELGWVIGRNLNIDYRWAAGDPDSLRKYATELRVLAPDAIVASGTQAFTAAQQTTRTVPIVFVNIVDPVSSGFVSSLAQPGGNATGFLMFEYATSAKWVELLKQIAP